MGSRNLKTIKGKQYLYYVISEDGQKRAMYCGLASKTNSERRALELELEEINARVGLLHVKANTIRGKLQVLGDRS